MNGERKHLLIPIHIDALAVPKGGGGFKKVNAAPQYSKLEKEYFIAADLRQAVPPKDYDLEPGIHLHFRLPATAAHWDQKREEGFPRIPNRWLVQRYYKPKSGGLRMKAWLIRGDEVAPAGASAVVLPVFRAKKRGREGETLLELWRTGEANWASGKEYNTPLELRRTGTKDVIWWGEHDSEAVPYKFGEDDKPAQVELTAVTGGDAGFSAHYPACRSILGLHDDLKDVPEETELSYLVTGWYSGKEDDPWSALVASVAEAANKRSTLTARLATEANEAKKKEIEKELGKLKKASEILDEWMKDRGCAEDFGKIDELGGAELAKKLPAGILCHGRVTNVVLQGKSSHAITRQRAPFEDFGRADQYWVDIGNSSAEAFAARVAAQLRTSARGKSVKDQQALLEDLITAFQTGQLSEGTDFSAVDDELHRQGFASAGGGGIWVIEPEAQAGSPKALGPEGARRTPARLPQVLQEKLDELNRCQREYERYARRFRDYQWELYAVWHRCMDAIFAEGSVEDQVKEALETSKESLKSFLGGYWGSETSKTQAFLAKSNRDAAIGALKDALKQYNDAQDKTGTKYVLPNSPGSSLPDAPQQPAAPFYMPNDPVLLVSGPAMRAINTEPRKKGALRCRLTGEELQSFIYDEVDGRKGLPKEATKLVEDLGLTNYLKAIPPWCQSLLKEALLQDDMAEKLARPKEYKPATILPKVGVLPDEYGTFQWEYNPWIPVYVYWEVEWRNEFTENGIHGRWTLDPGAGQKLPVDTNLLDLRRNTDLLPGGSGDENWPEGLPVIPGLSFPGLPLMGLQEEMFEGTAKDLLTQINRKMGNQLSRMMSVALGGFHEALIMRRAGEQLPPLDYARWKKENQNEDVPRSPFFLDEIGKALGPDFHPDSSPAGYLSRMERGSFCPVRAGSLKVERLRVIDAFGQMIDVPLEEMETEGFAHSGRLGSSVVPALPPPSFQLQPRFCRPLRLEFNGIPAGTQVAGAPPSTPVCGWVVLNRFDQNLVLYAANGRPASILQKFYKPEDLEITARLFHKVPVPRSSADGAAEDTIQNEHLKAFENFVLSLDLDEGLAFDKLLNQAVESTGQRAPEENPTVSVLIGRPLALVRAELCFEADGLPALDQEKSWIAPQESSQPSVGTILDPNLPTPLPNRFMVTGNVEDVRCPIRLGDRRSASDGLIGFFTGEPGSSPFHASRGFVFEKNTEKLTSLQKLLLDGRKPLKVTLLMDPQARVHATSGVLPRVFFQLPAAELAAARQVREVFFQTAPVLGTPATPHVPKPSDDYGQWSWAYRPDVTAWKDNPDLDSTSDRADFSMGWPTLTEGWLKLKIEPVRVRALWMSVPAQRPGKGETVTLAWSVQGADSVKLLQLSGAGKVEKEWPIPAHKKEWPVTIERETTFELRASDEAGYEDKKEITIQVKE